MDVREAVIKANVVKLQQLLDAGVNLDAKDEDERTPLHWAAGNGSVDVVEYLVEHAKARVNVQDDAGWTPLMSAASAGHSDVVSFLLSRGADANVPNENDQLPLHYHKGRQQIAELLLDYTKDINHADHLGNTPLMRALGGSPSREVIALLIDHGARLSAKDKAGNTALHLALMEGYEDIARYLIDNGADPMAKNRENVRCLDLARPAFRAEMQTLKPAK
ncbi:hypothetical protein Poli38472_006065 [Pythium oligandrum]|uniref:26S proteasome non-ATPase regulatory subunit 10 n=1 Tax=Pythium oligandrum TaxID=41045 RepID=A0A8K1FR42_PYTOL|nr:hypothetical protein Poli38472_006065 [Pythium oligandrum]|eukprot:TMW68597.1 hypothetical protein Poli38472_006065 [Pythium oligandrum]